MLCTFITILFWCDGAAPTGDASTTSEWSTILLPTKVQLILEVLQQVLIALGNDLVLLSPFNNDNICGVTMS